MRGQVLGSGNVWVLPGWLQGQQVRIGSWAEFGDIIVKDEQAFKVRGTPLQGSVWTLDPDAMDHDLCSGRDRIDT